MFEGLSSVIVPVYVGETSPAYMRGFLLTAFQVMICFGEMSASLISGLIKDKNFNLVKQPKTQLKLFRCFSMFLGLD